MKPEPPVADPEHAEHHVVGPRVYVAVWITLLCLTLLTVGAAFVEMGIFNPIVALAIACIKGVIVVLLFMHLKYSSRLVKFTCVSGFLTFSILIVMCLSDYLTRAWGQW
jgi:cytochrome c oxidase subunit 4